MRFIRNALIVGGIHFCFLFLMPGNAYSQLLPPSTYLFVEVKDTAGQKVTDANVTLTSSAGQPVFNSRTDEKGITKTNLRVDTFDHHYDFSVSKAGYLTSENVFFISPCCYASYFTTGDVTQYGIPWPTKTPLRVTVTLLKIPITENERQIIETEDRKYQFFLAIKRAQKDIVDKFLRAGISANTVDSNNIPAIAWAVFAGNGEIIRSLLAARADVRNPKSISNQSLLIYLTEGIPRNKNRIKTSHPDQYDETILSLIKAGAAINIKSPGGENPLNAAVGITPADLSPETINLLISSGADVTKLSSNDRTALMAATTNNSQEVIRMLVKAGTPINAQDSWGRTALMDTFGDKTPGAPIMKLLLELGADPNIKDNQGKSPLDYAHINHREDMINLLEQAGKRP